MTLTLKQRFLEAWQRAEATDQAAVLQVVFNLAAVLRDPHQHPGLGLRKLHPRGIWEVRVGLSLRAVFFLGSDQATFHLLGTHDEVQRFLRGL